MVIKNPPQNNLDIMFTVRLLNLKSANCKQTINLNIRYLEKNSVSGSSLINEAKSKSNIKNRAAT